MLRIDYLFNHLLYLWVRWLLSLNLDFAITKTFHCALDSCQSLCPSLPIKILFQASKPFSFPDNNKRQFKLQIYRIPEHCFKIVEGKKKKKKIQESTLQKNKKNQNKKYIYIIYEKARTTEITSTSWLQIHLLSFHHCPKALHFHQHKFLTQGKNWIKMKETSQIRTNVLTKFHTWIQ